MLSHTKALHCRSLVKMQMISKFENPETMHNHDWCMEHGGLDGPISSLCKMNDGVDSSDGNLQTLRRLLKSH